MVCHNENMPQNIDQWSSMIAPPILKVMQRINMNFTNSHDKAIFIANYAQNPSIDKSLCNKKGIDRFGLMPSQKGIVSNEELQDITKYLIDTYK